MTVLQSRFTADISEPKGLLLAGGALSVAGVLTTIVAPMLSGAFGETVELTNAQIGLVLTCLHVVQVAVIFGLATTGLVERLDRRMLGMIGCAIAAIAFVASSAVTDFAPLLVFQAVVGLGAGLAYAAGGSALSFAHHTERAYALVTIGSIFVGAGLLALTPTLQSIDSERGVYAGLAITLLILGVLGTRMPDLRAAPNRPTVPSNPDLGSAQLREMAQPPTVDSGATQWLDRAGVSLLAANFLLNVGLLSVWTFAGQIGESTGMDSTQSSLFLGASQLLSVIGCLIAWNLGPHAAKIPVLIGALLILALGKVLVGTAILSAYVVGMLTTNLAFYCVIPFVFAAGADLNPRSGRLVVLVGASAMTAGAIAPLVGGLLAGDDGNWMLLGLVAAAMVLLCIPLMTYAVRTAYHRKLATAPERVSA